MLLSKISKIEIKELFDKFDLVWNLNQDVNVLSGVNGSGKSTILELVFHALLYERKKPFPVLFSLARTVEITFNNGESIQMDMFALERKGLQIGKESVVIINTFDAKIPDLGVRPNAQLRTELDYEIGKLQKAYLDYQVNLWKKASNVPQNNKNSKQSVLEIRQTQERFLEIIDSLFLETGKKINRTENEITFLLGETKLSAYELSAGEKQLLIILLTLLIQDNKDTIVLMDEPEISLHFDWQKKLIQYAHEINPNAQLILATHSPAIIMEGWLDKVFNVQDLIVSEKSK